MKLNLLDFLWYTIVEIFSYDFNVWRCKITETEAEYEKWFDEKLGNFESIYSDNEKTIFDYCPKSFNLKHWLNGLFVLTILFIILAFIFYKIELNYLFNISLSISTGLIVNLIFLIITNAKERHINYYSSIIPILQKRRNQLSNAYHECWPQMSIAYQQNDKNKWYKYWHRLVNMSCVAIEFHNFLIERLPNDYKYDDNFQDVSDRLTDLNNMAFKFANTDEKIDFKKLNSESEKELHVIFTIIIQLDSLLEKLQLNLYRKLYKN